MRLPRRRFLELAAAAAALPAVSSLAHGQAYPTRPIRIVVGYPAGGSTDLARALSGSGGGAARAAIRSKQPGAGTNPRRKSWWRAGRWLHAPVRSLDLAINAI
jgi:hypothetical protein